MGVSVLSFGSPSRVSAAIESPRERTAIEIAINCANRREHRTNDEAAALEADCVIGWHQEVAGKTKAILKSRAESYAREQGTGVRALTLGDLCEAAVSGGREGRTAVRAALSPLMRTVEPVPVPMQGAAEALADYVREHADVTRAFLRGGSPAEVLRELAEADGALDVFKAAVIAAEKKGQ